MNILFINPSQQKVYGRKMTPAYPPLGLMYMGAILKKNGHSVRLLDIDIENINEESFKNVLTNFNPGAVGITCTTPTFTDGLKWGALSKKLKNGVTVVFGGVHPSMMPDAVIKNDAVDVVVTGEGEETAGELFDELSKPEPRLAAIKGIYFKSGGKIITTPARPFINDLDTIPFPDRTLLKNPASYLPPDAVYLPVASIMTSRGCPGKCTFCCTKNIFSERFRARSVQNMVREIEGLVRNENIKEIHIIDDVFTLNKKRTLEFCDQIRKAGLNVHIQLINGLRADFVDKEILEALKSIGVKTVGYGVETGNKEVLKNIRKNIPFDITRKAFRLSKELGFETWAFLIFGLPGESESTIKETIKFTKELNPDFAKFLILKPYPGSEIYRELDNNHLILSYDYDDYGVYTKPIHRLPGLDPERMIYWQKKALREFYLRPGKIFAYLKRIRSWAQFKLLVNDGLLVFHIMFRRGRK